MRGRARKSCLVMVIAFGLALPARGASLPENMLIEGIETYAGAQIQTDGNARAAAFERAYRLFIEAAAQGADNAEVYANAGTAALRGERLGHAILAFRRALDRDPDNARSRQNLLLARQLLPAWVPTPEAESALDSVFFWHRSFSSTERSSVAAFAFLIATLGLAISIRWPSALLRGLCMVPAMVWVGLMVSVLLEAREDTYPHAVIVAPETVARASDSVNAPARFTEALPEGAEVRIVEQRLGWARIRLANDREAWIKSSSYRVVRAAEVSSVGGNDRLNVVGDTAG